MSAILLWNQWQEDWSYQWKCTFDGENRLIIVNPGVTELSVKRDIYSAWKEWAQLRTNTKFPAAVRAIGGDSIGGGKFVGDIYFLINGWQLVINHLVRIDGVLFSDDFEEPYIINAGGVIATVSNVVQTVSTTGSSGTESCDYDQIATRVRQEIQSSLDLIDAPISSRASSTELTNSTTVLSNLLSAIDSKISLLDDQIVQVDVDLGQMFTIMDEVKKLGANRSKIDPTDKTLTIYDNDGITPIIVFDLLDTSGTPSILEVAEKVPR